MKEAHYTDKAGRMWATQLPDNAPDTDAELGIPLGPPSLEGLHLPEELEIRLHNELYARRIFTHQQAKANKLNVQAAMQSTLKLDVLHIVEIYRNTENSYTDGNSEGEEERETDKP
jgi:hypothetical protein